LLQNALRNYSKRSSNGSSTKLSTHSSSSSSSSSSSVTKSVGVKKSSPSVKSLELQWVYGLTGSATRCSVAVLSSGSVVYPASQVVVTHDMVAKKQLFFTKHTAAVTAIAHSNNNIVSGASNGGLWVHDARNPDKSWELAGGGSGVAIRAVGFSACNKYIVSVAGDQDSTVSVWEWQTSRKVVSMPSHAKSVMQVRWNHRNSEESGGSMWNQFCLVGEQHLSFWTMEQDQLTVVKAEEAGVSYNSVCFSNRGYACVASSDGTLQVFIEGKKRKTVPLAGKAAAAPAAVSVVYELEALGGVLAGTAAGVLYLLDNKLKIVKTLQVGSSRLTSCVLAGSVLAVTNSRNELFTLPADLNNSQASVLGSVEPSLRGHSPNTAVNISAPCNSHSVYTSSSMLASAAGGRLMLWDLHRRECTHQLEMEFGATRGSSSGHRLCWSADGMLVATGAYGEGGGEVHVFDTKSLSVVAAVQVGGDTQASGRVDIDCISFCPNGHVLAVAVRGRGLVLLTAVTGKLDVSATVSLPEEQKHATVSALDWSSDGTLLRARCGPFVCVFSIDELHSTSSKSLTFEQGKRQEEKAEWCTHNCRLGGIRPPCVSNSSKTSAISGDDSGQLCITALPTALTPNSASFSCPHSPVAGLTFSQDEQFVVTCGEGDVALFQWRVIS